MKVGSLGKIIFKVSANCVQTIRNINYTGSANISTHSRHNKVGLVEYTGENPAQVTFSMRVSAFLNADPVAVEKTLRDYIRNGTAVTLVIGSQKIGRYKWLVQKFKSTIQNTDRRGNPIDADISITLIEYVKG